MKTSQKQKRLFGNIIPTLVVSFLLSNGLLSILDPGDDFSYATVSSFVHSNSTNTNTNTNTNTSTSTTRSTSTKEGNERASITNENENEIHKYRNNDNNDNDDNNDDNDNDNDKNITVTILLNRPGGYKDYGYSLFEIGHLQEYSRKSKSWWTYDTKYVNFGDHFLFGNEKNGPELEPPCLLVSNPKGLKDALQHNYAPQCYTWLVNDEWCKHNATTLGGSGQKNTDVRFYYQEQEQQQQQQQKQNQQQNRQKQQQHARKNVIPPVYLPLGPRYDFWKAFQEHREQQPTKNRQSNPSTTATAPTSTSTSTSSIFALPTMAERKYIFNAVFTKATSPSRKLLKQLLLKETNSTDKMAIQIQQHPQDYFLQIAPKWSRQLGRQHLKPAEYVQVLLQSQFTLSPTGHSPECFRIYEAILAGSIPIIVLGDDEYQHHACPNALQPLLQFEFDNSNSNDKNNESNSRQHHPMVVLQNWTQLESTLDDLLADPVGLQQRQVEMKSWYAQFMTYHVQQLENLLSRPATATARHESS